MIVPGANHMGTVEFARVYNEAIARFAVKCFAPDKKARARREDEVLKS